MEVARRSNQGQTRSHIVECGSYSGKVCHEIKIVQRYNQHRQGKNHDINKKEKFQELFGETYIGKNPTKFKNSYYILRFNFSEIDTTNEETTIKGFQNTEYLISTTKNVLFNINKGVGNNYTLMEGYQYKNFYATSIIGPILARNDNLAQYFLELLTKND